LRKIGSRLIDGFSIGYTVRDTTGGYVALNGGKGFAGEMGAKFVI
jgi:hypothetical protein